METTSISPSEKGMSKGELDLYNTMKLEDICEGYKITKPYEDSSFHHLTFKYNEYKVVFRFDREIKSLLEAVSIFEEECFSVCIEIEEFSEIKIEMEENLTKTLAKLYIQKELVDLKIKEVCYRNDLVLNLQRLNAKVRI